MIDLFRAGEDFNYQCPEERAKGYNCYDYVSDLRSPLVDAHFKLRYIKVFQKELDKSSLNIDICILKMHFIACNLTL
jgi:hypothetical protein